MGTGLSSHLCSNCWTFLLPRRNDEKISQDMQHVRTSPRINLTKALDPYRDLKTSYDTSPVAFLGQGSCGSVYRVTCKTSGCSRAVKQISKTGVSRDRLRRELQLLLELDHPHIIRLNHWFEDEYSVYLVTEYATCGDLDSHCPGSPSAEAARLYSQLVRAVRYLHDRGICHRDLKGSNCLLTGDVLKPTVKVIDFGVAMVQGPGTVSGEWLDGRVGTISHMAPEVFELGRKYGLKCDIWSAGIILFVLVTGKQPFPNGCKEEASAGHGSAWRLRRLPPRKKEDGLPKHLLQLLARAGVKRELRSLLQSMLSWDPEERPEAHMVLRHPWLATRESTIDRKTLRRVLAWSMANATPLRQAVATAQAHTMQDDEVTEIRSTFQAIDSEGRGYLTESAIGEGFRKCGLEIEDEELTILFEALDREHSGQISWTDWLTAALTPDSIASERHLKLALTYIDMNNNGEVSPSELSSVLGESVAEAAFVRWDSDGDRKLSMDEVKAAMEGIAALKAELCQSPKVS